MINVRKDDILSWDDQIAPNLTRWLDIKATPDIKAQFETLEALGLIRKRIFSYTVYYSIGPALVTFDGRNARYIALPEDLVNII